MISPNTSCRYCVFKDQSGTLVRAAVHGFAMSNRDGGIATVALVTPIFDQEPHYGGVEWVAADRIVAMAPNKDRINKAWGYLLHVGVEENPAHGEDQP